MASIRPLVVLVAMSAMACRASYPTAPTPTAVSIEVLFAGDGTSSLVSSKKYSFDAYLLLSDGGYQRVTKEAMWTSSDTGIARTTSPGEIEVVGVGFAKLTVRHAGASGVLALPATERWPGSAGTPRLVFLEGPSSTLTTGSQYRMRVLIERSASRFEELPSGHVTWTSSNTAVAVVNAGMVTGARIGTTVITAAFEGLTVNRYLSVHPGL